MGEREIEAFLTYLAIDLEVSPATQNQALNALVFLFRNVLEKDLGTFTNIRWAKRKCHIPVVLTREEMRVVLSQFRKGSVQESSRSLTQVEICGIAEVVGR